MADDIPQDGFSIWERRFNQHGWPTMLCVLMAFLVWHFSAWAEPRATQLIDEHLATVKKLSENAEKQLENSSRQTLILDGVNGTLRENGAILKEVHDNVLRFRERDK